MNRSALLVSFLSFLILSPSAHCESRQDLSKGMSFSEVLTSWGSPDEKIEKESRREVVWIYGDKSVSFREGRVVSAPGIETAKSENSSTLNIHKGGKKVADVENGTEGNSPVAMDEIFNEVMRSIPPDQDSNKSPGRSMNAPPSMNRIIPGKPGGEMAEEEIE